MRNGILFFLVLAGLSSCFLSRDYRKREFAYTANGQPQTLGLLAPKGFTKEEVSDTAGIRLYSFQYPGGATLYAAYLTDTTYELQSINRVNHQPKPIGSNGLVYKGQSSGERFYREIRMGNLRFGYRDVTEEKETYFDSATNYAAMRR